MIRLFNHLPRYAIVGAICAGIYNATMIVGAAAHVHYVVSTLIAYVEVVAVGYALHCLFTFSQSFGVASAVRYVLVTAINIPISIGLMFVLHDLLRLPMIVASPTLTLMLVVWNYLASRWALLRLGSPPPGGEGAGL
jgi:putative flippase GtrA